jgi:hypothetical protein
MTARTAARRAESLVEVASLYGPGTVVILAGGQAFRAPVPALAQLAADYWLDAPVAAISSPPEHPSVQRFELPAEWLVGMAYVVALGKQRNGSTCTAMRVGDGWNTYVLHEISIGAPLL